VRIDLCNHACLTIIPCAGLARTAQRAVTVVGMKRWLVAGCVVVSCGAVAIGAWVLLAGDARTSEPPSGVVALINASAPLDDVSASQFCTGILVDDRTVATALHCVADRDVTGIDVIVDARNLCSTAAIVGERVRVVSSHPVEGGVDATLLELAHPVEYGSPVVVAESAPPPGAELDAWGWGSASPGGPSPCSVERKSLRSVGAARCDRELAGPRALPSFRERDYLCAVPRDVAGASANTCLGDSGGPVFEWLGGTGERRATVELVGMTLAGRGCGADDPGLYLAAGAFIP
jgi:hypothetical protein